MKKGTRTETVLRTLGCLTEMCSDIKETGGLKQRANFYTSKYGCGTFQKKFIDEIMERDGNPTYKDAESLLDRRNERMKKMAAERKAKKQAEQASLTQETMVQASSDSSIIDCIRHILTNGFNINISVKFEF